MEPITEKLIGQFHKVVRLLHHRRHADWHKRFGFPSFMDGFALKGQGKLLSLLLEQDGMSHKDIVQALDIRPSTESELVAKLEQAGFVEKKANQQDKRVSNVYLTEKGRQMAEKTSQNTTEQFSDIFEALSDAEQQQLSALLEKLILSWSEKYTQRDENFPPHSVFHEHLRGNHHTHHKTRPSRNNPEEY